MRWLPTEVCERPFDPSDLPWAVSQCQFVPYWGGAKVYWAYQAGGRPTPQTTLDLSVCQNWRRWKGVPFDSIPQSQSTMQWPITITFTDHWQLVKDGVAVLDAFNATCPKDKEPFQLVGDADALELRCFWYKVRSLFYCDFFQIWPPKKNLETNLRNHVEGTKHAGCVHCEEKKKSKSSNNGRKGHLAPSSKTVSRN